MKRFLSAGIVTAVAVGLLGACPGVRDQAADTTAVAGDAGPRASVAVLTCDTTSGFDPEPSHQAKRRRIKAGVVVSIVPHLQSNQYSLPDLWEGRIVAKFVNHGREPYEPLQLSANGQSCLAIRSVIEDGVQQVVAEAIPHGSQTGRRLKGLDIDLKNPPHPTPLARWINVPRAQLDITGMAVAGRPMGQLIRFVAAVQDSSPAPGPGAWVTCVTNGCCRVSAEE